MPKTCFFVHARTASCARYQHGVTDRLHVSTYVVSTLPMPELLSYCLNMSFTYGVLKTYRSSCDPSLKFVCYSCSRWLIMSPAETISKSMRAMSDQIDRLQPAAKGGGERTGAWRFHSWRRMTAREQRAKATETSAREESPQYVAASTQRSTAEVTTLRAEMERNGYLIQPVPDRWNIIITEVRHEDQIFASSSK
jgi:hypothetical protein